MKRLFQLGSVVTALCALLVPGLKAATMETNLTLRGTFTWANEGSQKHELQAKLTPTGTNEWRAVWDFKWKQRPMTFTGIVKGNLHNGSVTGTGEMAEAKRRFAFEGTAKDGALKFEHYEVTRGKGRTGTGEVRLAN